MAPFFKSFTTKPFSTQLILSGWFYKSFKKGSFVINKGKSRLFSPHSGTLQGEFPVHFWSSEPEWLLTLITRPQHSTPQYANNGPATPVFLGSPLSQLLAMWQHISYSRWLRSAHTHTHMHTHFHLRAVMSASNWASYSWIIMWRSFKVVIWVESSISWLFHCWGGGGRG